MTADLVARLRAEAEFTDYPEYAELFTEAANEIERMTDPEPWVCAEGCRHPSKVYGDETVQFVPRYRLHDGIEGT